jgi:3-methyladenine DNA glycosylase/8-oxoguanine DNA glycosylase
MPRDLAEWALEPEHAGRHLASRDARLRPIIEKVGPVRLKLDASKTTFEALAESIVYQQLTGKAAATIHGRVLALFPGERARPDAVLTIGDDALRGAGLSRGKILAVRDLASKVLDGSLPTVKGMAGMTDEAIVEQLVKVRGIGRWSAEMLLIFRLGRPDVLPVHDYGVRLGLKLAYRKRTMPTPAELARAGEKWRPFRTAASWYLWRAVDLARQESRQETSGGGRSNPDR